MAFSKLRRRQSLHGRIRAKISGTADRPRLSVFRSNKQIYAQIIDDLTGATLCSVRSTDTSVSSGSKLEVATSVGKMIASKALENNINSVVFDRSGYLYHGRIKALAEGAREGGLKL